MNCKDRGAGAVMRAGEAAYTTGDWWLGPGSVAGLEKQGPRETERANLRGLEKQGPGKATRLRAWKNKGAATVGVTTTGDKDWRQEQLEAGGC